MSAVPEDCVLTGRDGHVGIVTFNRPPHNFFDAESIGLLARRMREMAADETCRAFLLRSAGKSFCAGANFGNDGGGVDAGVAGRIYEGAIALFEIEKPIVAAIQGPAIGGGLGVALVADFRVACPEARFSANFARLGIHSGFGISATLPRVVGLQNAHLLLQTGRRIGAEEALRIGLVEKVVEKTALDGEALALARELAEGAPLAVQSMRRTLMGDRAELVRRAVRHELSEQKLHMASADFAEGIAAAHARRMPAFSGR